MQEPKLWSETEKELIYRLADWNAGLQLAKDLIEQFTQNWSIIYQNYNIYLI